MNETDAIVDLSHFNQNADFELAKASGILGVIHKATEGTGFFDPVYASRRAAATQAGLLWGAYHFGDGTDGLAQAQYFLKKVQPDSSILLALDYETNPSGPTMTLDQARAFVSYVQQITGRWPGLYGGDLLRQHAQEDDVLANCWLWLAQYEPTPVVPSSWATWTLWQYTDSATVPGIGPCDRSRFNGTAAELMQFWSRQSAPIIPPP